MADHDEPTGDRSEADHAEMRRRLDEVASVVDVGDLEVARADVGHRVGRRRTRRRIGVTIGAVAVIAAATTAVLTVGGDEPDTLVTTDDTQVTASLPDDDVESPEPTLAVAPVTPSVEVIDGVAQVGASAGSNGAPEYGEWSVPWEDGFLVGSTYFPPQPLPDELPEEVRALFPQEVLDLFDGGLPATISEATTMLSDAGLLDVVSEIIATIRRRTTPSTAHLCRSRRRSTFDSPSTAPRGNRVRWCCHRTQRPSPAPRPSVIASWSCTASSIRSPACLSVVESSLQPRPISRPGPPRRSCCRLRANSPRE